MSKKICRGPSGGYESDAKEAYRNSIWDSLAPIAIPVFKDHPEAHVLLLPSKNGREIKTAIDHGIPQNRIVAIDENPAIIAVSEWRKKYPDVKFYGCKLSQVGEKLKKDGIVLIAANIDLCNNLSSELIEELSKFRQSILVYDRWAFAVTMAKGRENKGITALLNLLNVPATIKDGRLSAVLQASKLVDSNSFVLDHDSYINNRQPMAWIIIGRFPGLKITFPLLLEKLQNNNDRCKKIIECVHWFEENIIMKRNKKYNIVNKFRMKGTHYRSQNLIPIPGQDKNGISIRLTKEDKQTANILINSYNRKVKMYKNCVEYHQDIIDEIWLEMERMNFVYNIHPLVGCDIRVYSLPEYAPPIKECDLFEA